MSDFEIGLLITLTCDAGAAIVVFFFLANKALDIVREKVRLDERRQLRKDLYAHQVHKRCHQRTKRKTCTDPRKKSLLEEEPMPSDAAALDEPMPGTKPSLDKTVTREPLEVAPVPMAAPMDELVELAVKPAEFTEDDPADEHRPITDGREYLIT